MMLSPHELVQIRAHHILMYPFHAFKLSFDSIPVRFYVLCMCACGRVNECDGMVDSTMLGNRRKVLDIVVGCPFIAMDDGTRPNMLLNYWQQRCSIPLCNHLHIAKSWGVADIHHAKYPYLIPWRMSMVGLELDSH